MPRLPTFSREGFERTARVVRQVEREQLNTQSRRPRGLMSGVVTYIGLTDGSGITARSGTTLGSGTVTLYKSDEGVLTQHLDESGAAVTKTFYNLSETAVGASGYVIGMQETLGGAIFVVWEDCPSA